MTITIDPKFEARLRNRANAEGISVSVYVERLISADQAATEAVPPLSSLPRESGELDRVIDEVFDTVHVPPGVGEGAMRRQ